MSRYTVTQTYFNSVVRHSKARQQREFNIDIPYLDELFIKQGGRCAYTGLPLSFRRGTASLDRIVNTIGYVKGNVQWVHKDVNMMKRHYSEDYFLYLCTLIADKASKMS